MILCLEILSLHSRDIVIIGFLGKTGNWIVSTGNGIILTFQWDSHFPIDDFRLWNFVNSSFLARDIVIISFLGKTGNRIVSTGNGIILTLWWVSHFPVDDSRLWNFVSSSFLARDIVIISLLFLSLLGKTGNRIAKTGNGIILTF